jgi:osmotically-inducible protein OsmY
MYLSGLEPHSDDAVLSDVRAALARAPELAQSEVVASCDRGVVTLSGTASSDEARALAEQIAFEARGVIDVVNHVEIPTPAPTIEPPPPLQ